MIAVAGPDPEVTPWLEALQALVPVPAGHAEPSIGLGEGEGFLGCSPAAWEALLGAGLPRHGDGFDRDDLANLAMLAACGRSVPEMALRFALRFIGSDPAAWCAPSRWRFQAELSCECEGDVDEAARAEEWRLWPPLSWPEPARSVERGRRTLGGDRASVSYEVDVVGEEMEIGSAAARKAIDEFHAEGWRFARMPVAVQFEREWMAGERIFDCLSGSLELQRRLGAAGLETRVRQGWLASLAMSSHAWLEVRDEDGRWKAVDLAYRSLAQQLFPGSEAFQRFCLGSRLNRLIASDAGVEEAPIEHVCGRRAAVTRIEVAIAKAPAKAGAAR